MCHYAYKSEALQSNLCLVEKLCILKTNKDEILNKRSELLTYIHTVYIINVSVNAIMMTSVLCIMGDTLIF